MEAKDFSSAKNSQNQGIPAGVITFFINLSGKYFSKTHVYLGLLELLEGRFPQAYNYAWGNA